MNESNVESVEVLPSEDNGNVPAEAPKAEPATPVTPTVEKKEETPAEPETFELPDGRKVDAETLSKEWKENFYPDYTRKSQELAKVKNPEPAQPINPVEDPNWTPKSYSEIVQIAKQEMKNDLAKEAQAQVDARQSVENEVITQLSEVKKVDAGVNENALFLHATKYGFRDLRIAHQNMKDMAELAKNVQQTTAKNIAKRNDPVSASSGSGTSTLPNPSHFATAAEYLRSLK